MEKKERPKDYTFAAQGDYLITVCVKDRKPLLTRRDAITELSEAGNCVEECILRIPQVYPSISLVKYTIMPNHFHMLLHISAQNSVRLKRVMEQTKGVITKKLGESIFQHSYYEHLIEDEEDYRRTAEYVDVNLSVWQRDHYYER